MQKVGKVDSGGRNVVMKRRQRAKLSDREIRLIHELVGSLRAGGLQPMVVYHAIAQRLQQRSLDR